MVTVSMTFMFMWVVVTMMMPVIMTMLVVVTMVIVVGMIVVACNCGYTGGSNHGDGDTGYHAQ